MSAINAAAMLCAAEGCGWIGTAGDSGRFLCLAHHRTDAAQWPRITERTTELQWFADFIAEIQHRIHERNPKTEAWVLRAREFWRTNDHAMAPTPREAKQPELYVYRLLGVLRAQARGAAEPAAFVPQCEWPEFAKSRQDILGEVAA